jgi:hypothetical protein
MKRIVGSVWAAGSIVAVLTLAVVAATGADAGATYLIAIGFGAILIVLRKIQEEPPRASWRKPQ